MKAPVLVLHGADDPYVQPQAIESFMKTMAEAEADWQFIHYSGAVHTFTNPEAGDDKSTGAAYDKAADKRSWQHMQVFFNEIFE